MIHRVVIGSDHAGFDYKNRIGDLLRDSGFEVVDVGVMNEESSDYPDPAADAARLVSDSSVERGILVCGSGIGVSIVANKFRNVRAANCLTVEMAQLARQHNDANVLTIGQRLVAWEDVPSIVTAFLETPASDEQRHQRRVEKIHELSGC